MENFEKNRKRGGGEHRNEALPIHYEFKHMRRKLPSSFPYLELS